MAYIEVMGLGSDQREIEGVMVDVVDRGRLEGFPLMIILATPEDGQYVDLHLDQHEAIRLVAHLSHEIVERMDHPRVHTYRDQGRPPI